MKRVYIAALICVPITFLTGCAMDTSTYPVYAKSTYGYSVPVTVYPVGFGIANYGYYDDYSRNTGLVSYNREWSGYNRVGGFQGGRR